MPTITKIDETGAVVGEHQLSDDLVEPTLNTALLHEVMRAELAAYRQGTRAAKSRGQVSGSGAKPWRQKGTGRARAGSSRLPHWRGGGVAFPPMPRDWSLKVNKKARAKAFRMALGNLVENDCVRVLSGAEYAQPSTKRAATFVGKANLAAPLLVVTSPDELEMVLSFRNIPGIRVFPVNVLEVQDYIWARSAVLTEAAVSMLEGGAE